MTLFTRLIRSIPCTTSRPKCGTESFTITSRIRLSTWVRNFNPLFLPELSPVDLTNSKLEQGQKEIYFGDVSVPTERIVVPCVILCPPPSSHINQPLTFFLPPKVGLLRPRRGRHPPLDPNSLRLPPLSNQRSPLPLPDPRVSNSPTPLPIRVPLLFPLPRRGAQSPSLNPLFPPHLA